MRLWLIPMIYVGCSVVCGLALPHIEQAYFSGYSFNLSVASAQALLSAAASGMMALMGIVFALAFVMVQFSAIAYSPRLVLWFAHDPSLFHALGAFAATFLYALFTLAWVDRGASGTVPLFSTLLVAVMLIVSMLLFSRMVQRLSDLQITNVLRLIGDRGRDVIRMMFPILDEKPYSQGRSYGRAAPQEMKLAPIIQRLKYSGEPRSVAKFDIDTLIRQAQRADQVIVMTCAVSDTVVEDTLLLQVHGVESRLLERELMRSIHLGRDRTFEQDPKYPIRLLVDIAIKALSPAINDPTTAVQTIDQIEDLLHRLGRRELDTGYFGDANGVLRLIIPMPTWEDYLALGFDEIRHYGVSSIQVMRRLRSALLGLAESLAGSERAEAVQKYLRHLDWMIEHSPLDAEDRVTAGQRDPQGLGLARISTE